MSARDDVLGAVRAALRDVTPSDPARRPASIPRPGVDLLARFTERVEHYRAQVVRCGTGELEDAVADLVAGGSCVVPPGLGLDVRGDVVVDGEPTVLSAVRLDEVACVVTAARVGVAETGTVVLDHAPDQGRRALTLVPDHHVCVVRADQVVADVPDAVALLDPARPHTWISGPSATSDIELTRVEGVHGPRRLDVVLVG